jgi:hypothetical protein
LKKILGWLKMEEIRRDEDKTEFKTLSSEDNSGLNNIDKMGSVGHREHKHSEKSEHKSHTKHHKRKNDAYYWKISTFVILGLFIIYLISNGFTLNFSSKDSVAEDTLTFINTEILQGQEATLKSVAKSSGLYQMTIDVAGQEIEGYVTKDGKLFFPQAIKLDATASPSAPGTPSTPPVVPKTDKPVVEMFIMSHCPYGTQIEKGMLPVAKLLDDKIDFEIKFVYYAMHGEVETTEQTKQYCIQKEQNAKYFDYLNCFLEAGDTAACLTEAKIDTAGLDKCVVATDKEFSVTKNLEDKASWLSGKFPMFDIHKAENTKYAVKGSPSLVINGESVSAGRDSVSLLAAVCNSFTEVPAECDTEFEAGAPGPGFGWSSTGSDNLATCG